jgi:predicted metal-dependent HD superfamily phosphohydrolase
VIEDFLQRPSLFYTPMMVASLEERARRNLNTELRELGQARNN